MLHGDKDYSRFLPCFTVPLGPAASQIAINQLGTNGGGLLIYGLGGIVVPFIAIKLIDMLLTACGIV